MIERRDYPDAPGCNAAGPSELAAAAISAATKTLRDKAFSAITPAPRGPVADESADAKATHCLHKEPDCDRFDWNSLAVDAKTVLEQRKERLIGLFKATSSNKLQIGTELRSIKHQLRGQFIDFVERELPFSVKTAQRLMQLCEHSTA
jgi:hypothetical protein